MTALIQEIGDEYIYDDADADHLKQEIVLVDVRNPAAQMIVPAPRTRMTPLNVAQRNLELRVLGLREWSQEERSALVAAMVPLIRPNVVLDQTATATAREMEANKIPKILTSLKKNQVIAREGDTVTRGNARAVIRDQEHRSQRPALALPRGTVFSCVGSLLDRMEVCRTQKYCGSTVAVETKGICSSGFSDCRSNGINAGRVYLQRQRCAANEERPLQRSDIMELCNSVRRGCLACGNAC